MYKVGKYILDEEQTKIVVDDSNHLLVVAGAGSGKTLTILGKIKYLVEEKNINPSEILCISFTKKASSSLEDKIKKDLNLKVPVYTFHKLALDILKDNNYKIADSNLLEDIIHDFFINTIINYPYQLNLVKKYFHEKDYYKILKRKDFIYLERNISTFIHLLKCNGYNTLDFKSFFKKIKWTLFYKKYIEEKCAYGCKWFEIKKIKD
jgi:DNA helicase-4